MTKTTAPKAPRLTKAQKLAMIELETQTIERQIAEELGNVYVAPIEVDPVTLTMATIATEAPKTNDEAVSLDDAMKAVVHTKTMKVVKTVKTGVGAQILELIAQGKLTNKEIVAQVLTDNPLRKTTYACVAWYKSQVAAGKIDLPVIEETEETTEE